MKVRILLTVALIATFVVAATAQKTKKTTKPKTSTAKVTTSAPPTQNDYASGLRETLSNGVSNAVKSLGREDGFFKNVEVKIPVPKSLQTVEKGLRVAGQGAKVDAFVLAMNRAAE